MAKLVLTKMSTSIIAQDPQWDVILAKIPEDIIDPRDRPRLIVTLTGVAAGLKWGEIAIHGLSKPEYAWLKQHSPDFQKLAKEAQKVADEVRQLEREEESHDRAVNGEPTPTVAKDGSIVNWYKKRSDRLMELLLKANDPAKYREAKTEVGGPGKIVLSVNIGIPNRVPKTIEGETDVKEIGEGENKSGGLRKSGPEPADSPGPGPAPGA